MRPSLELASLSAVILILNEKQREFPAPPWAGVKRVRFAPLRNPYGEVDVEH